MPAGEYYAVAVDDMDAEYVRDPDFLERLSRGAARIVIGEDARAEVSLRRIKLADVLREP